MSQSFETTTDAFPSPPRGEENVHVPNNQNKTTQNGPRVDYQNKSGTQSPPLRKAKKSRSKRKSGSGSTFVQVINSPWTHVGAVIYNNCNTDCKKENHVRKENEVEETKETAAIKNNKKPVTIEDIDAVAFYIGAGWENTFTQLGLADNDIRSYKRNCTNNLEIKRSLLRDWTRKYGKDNATVGVLAEVLWNTNQRQAVKIWASKYDDLN